ncbi:MAG TPA: ABC-type transport auxiliary lipoprotein family protein [Gammaproteobacteria bacterium]|nr:ABC-type transport auxiliary lipoprotein family protein [Gammaproteobacteria bacterium]
MRRVSVLVLPPVTDPVYDTTQMAYTTGSHQVAYFAKSSWAAMPSQMLQPLLVQTLQDTHHFRTVSGMSGWYSDDVVASQILLLQQDFTVCPAQFKIVVRVQLINSSTNTVKATKLFTVTEPMRRHNPAAGVDAANRATATLLKHIAVFCVHHI